MTENTQLNARQIMEYAADWLLTDMRSNNSGAYKWKMRRRLVQETTYRMMVQILSNLKIIEQIRR